MHGRWHLLPQPSREERGPRSAARPLSFRCELSCAMPRHQQEGSRFDHLHRHLANVDRAADAAFTRGAFDASEIWRRSEHESQIVALISAHSDDVSEPWIGVDRCNSAITSKTCKSICGVEKSFFIV